MADYLRGKVIIIFDGNCNLCNRWVLFIIRRDGYDRFRFTASQLPPAQYYLEKFHILKEEIDTFLLVEDDSIYRRSAAVLRLFRHLPGLWPMVFALRIIPPFIRDGIYNFIARNRYRWFGKRETCFVADETQRKKYLE